MDMKQEILRKVDMLPPALQEQVLRFVTALNTSTPMGEKGADLRRYSSSLDCASAQEMTRAIEDECERVEACEW
jgi:hypothetical protein